MTVFSSTRHSSSMDPPGCERRYHWRPTGWLQRATEVRMSAPLSLEEILNFLLETPLFGDLDAHELSEVVHIMQVQGLRQGQTVFAENQEGDAWYVLYEGQC